MSQSKDKSKDIQKELKMNLDKELLEVHSEVNQITLSEGLVFFKDSKRIRKYINKIRKKDVNDELRELIEELTKSAKEFERAEKLFSLGRKEEAKELHSRLKSNNLNLIKTLNKESVKTALIRIGIAAFVLNLALTMFTGVGLFSRIFSLFGGGSQAVGASQAIGSPTQPNMPSPAGATDMAVLAQEREELTARSRELSNRLRDKQGRIGDINSYESSLRDIENQRRRAERLAEQAQRSAERTSRRAERRISRAQSSADRLADRL